ncbi:MAG: hypothetical protein LBP30_03470, partial [Clostridiales Family XIII bacterium]|nr:hypothetical protein [Clostridiales Family XIII bacterium]
MPTKGLFPQELKDKPFNNHAEYADCLFACVNARMDACIANMKPLFMSDEGAYKNVLYPDIETAHEFCKRQLSDFTGTPALGAGGPGAGGAEAQTPAMPDDLNELFAEFSGEGAGSEAARPSFDIGADELMAYVEGRARATDLASVPLPIHALSQKLGFAPFSLFCFASALLSSMQTSYASVFQIINRNASLTAPSFESAARLYYGDDFGITAASGDMSLALEQLEPILDMDVNKAMPFSTLLSPDKRMIDFLFGKFPLRPD